MVTTFSMPACPPVDLSPLTVTFKLMDFHYTCNENNKTRSHPFLVLADFFIPWWDAYRHGGSANATKTHSNLSWLLPPSLIPPIKPTHFLNYFCLLSYSSFLSLLSFVCFLNLLIRLSSIWSTKTNIITRTERTIVHTNQAVYRTIMSRIKWQVLQCTSSSSNFRLNEYDILFFRRGLSPIG
jgi:hypothetical protein